MLSVTAVCTAAGAIAAANQSMADTDTGQARIAELEAQIEAMIEQMPSGQPQRSDSFQQLESERDAANSRIAELESQVEAMIEQIGSSADEAVVSLEKDIVHLKKELQEAQKDNAATHAMAAEAVGLLQESNKERDASKLQVWFAVLCYALTPFMEGAFFLLILSCSTAALLIATMLSPAWLPGTVEFCMTGLDKMCMSKGVRGASEPWILQHVRMHLGLH